MASAVTEPVFDPRCESLAYSTCLSKQVIFVEVDGVLRDMLMVADAEIIKYLSRGIY